MKPLDRRIKVGTKVKLAGISKILRVKEVHETRCWLKVETVMGSFQATRVESFTNRGNL